MSLERHTTKAEWSRLPADIIVKIAFCLSEASDTFALLEALHPYNILGPLEHLYRLGLTLPHAKLWPKLHLNRRTLEASHRLSFEAIVQYYPDVMVDKKWEDVEWLKTHLDPMARIQWCMSDSIETVEDLTSWVDLRITRLSIDSQSIHTMPWPDLLPHLRHLTSLSVKIEAYNLSDYIAFVAKSNQISELCLRSSTIELIESDVFYLMAWLRHRPVRAFRCNIRSCATVESDMLREYYQTIFDCPSLERLSLTHLDFEHVDFTRLTLNMTLLELNSYSLNSDIVTALARYLKGSKVTRLQLDGYKDRNIKGLESLLRILPQTSIKHLVLKHLQIGTRFYTLAPLFEFCPLEMLAIGGQKFDLAACKRFAAAIQSNQTIRALELDSHDFDIDSLPLIIQSFLHSSRPVKQKKLIKLTMSVTCKPTHKSKIESIKKLAVQSGCQVVQDHGMFRVYHALSV